MRQALGLKESCFYWTRSGLSRVSTFHWVSSSAFQSLARKKNSPYWIKSEPRLNWIYFKGNAFLLRRKTQTTYSRNGIFCFKEFSHLIVVKTTRRRTTTTTGPSTTTACLEIAWGYFAVKVNRELKLFCCSFLWNRFFLHKNALVASHAMLAPS